MSTTFGIQIPGIEEPVEIAFRSNEGTIIWKSLLAQLLPRETKVIPLDNDAQGIRTIGDIIDESGDSYKETT